MGYVVGTFHVETQVIGLVMYGITSFVYAADQKDAESVIAKELDWLYDRLLYWEANIDKVNTPWASFLLREDQPN